MCRFAQVRAAGVPIFCPAVIFLVTPQTQLAAVSVLLLDDAGNANQAAAFSVCIMLVVALALLLFQLALRVSGRRSVSLFR